MFSKQKILFTPGPLNTKREIKESMLIDLGTRDSEYANLVQRVRGELLQIAFGEEDIYTAVFMQGSGTFAVESVLTTAVGKKGHVLILSNGAYGERMEQIAQKAGLKYTLEKHSMIEGLKEELIEKQIAKEEYSHVAVVHCETTAGVLNDLEMVDRLTRQYSKILIVDGMSSFGGIPINLSKTNVDFLITSANKCLHSVPGLGIIFAKKTILDACRDNAASLSLDLYEQYKEMEKDGNFRFTSPTHAMLALEAALSDLNKRGGIVSRNKEYTQKQDRICQGMSKLGFSPLVEKEHRAPIITTFLCPEHVDFGDMYEYLKQQGFLLYNGKLSNYNAFRIGNIGEISMEDIENMLGEIQTYLKVRLV